MNAISTHTSSQETRGSLRTRLLGLIQEARDRQRRRRIRIALAVAVVIAATGGVYALTRPSPSASLASACVPGGCKVTLASAVLPNPCSLISDHQAAALLGSSRILYTSNQPLQGGSESPSQARMCTWQGSPLSNFGYNAQTLTLQIIRTTPARFARDEKTRWGHVTRVAGVGEAAFTTTGPAYVLVVRDRDYELEVQAPGGLATQTEESFARLAVNHLH